MSLRFGANYQSPGAQAAAGCSQYMWQWFKVLSHLPVIQGRRSVFRKGGKSPTSTWKVWKRKEKRSTASENDFVASGRRQMIVMSYLELQNMLSLWQSGVTTQSNVLATRSEQHRTRTCKNEKQRFKNNVRANFIVYQRMPNFPVSWCTLGQFVIAYVAASLALKLKPRHTIILPNWPSVHQRKGKFGLRWYTLKEELHNRLNLSLEECVNNFKHNSENLMKIGWKIRKLWHFEVSQIITKHFLTSRYEYANDWVDDVITSLLAIYFVHKILKILIFCPNLW